MNTLPAIRVQSPYSFATPQPAGGAPLAQAASPEPSPLPHEPIDLPPELKLQPSEAPSHAPRGWRRLGLEIALAASLVGVAVPAVQHGMQAVTISREVGSLEKATIQPSLRSDIPATPMSVSRIADAGRGIQLSPDGRVALLDTEQPYGSVLVRTADGSVEATIPDRVSTDSALLEDGRLLTWGNRIELRDANNGEVTSSLPSPRLNRPSVCGNRVAYVVEGEENQPGVLRLVTATPKGLEEVRVPLVDRDAQIASWSADGTHVALVSSEYPTTYETHLVVVDARSGQVTFSRDVTSEDFVTKVYGNSNGVVSLSHDGSMVAYVATHGTDSYRRLPSTVVDVKDGRVTWQGYGFDGAQFSPTGDTLALSHDGGVLDIQALNARSGQSLWSAHMPGGSTGGDQKIQFSPDGSRLAVDAGDAVRVLDSNNGHALWGVHTGNIAVPSTFSADGQRIAVPVGVESKTDGSTLAAISLRDATDGHEIIQQAVTPTSTTIVSADGKVLLAFDPPTDALRVFDTAHAPATAQGDSGHA